MKLKLLYLASTALLISTAYVQADKTRYSNAIINKLVADKKVDEGWHYTLKNDTKEYIFGLVNLQGPEGNVRAPFVIPPGAKTDFYTLRGKDYAFNQSVTVPQLSEVPTQDMMQDLSTPGNIAFNVISSLPMAYDIAVWGITTSGLIAAIQGGATAATIASFAGAAGAATGASAAAVAAGATPEIAAAIGTAASAAFTSATGGTAAASTAAASAAAAAATAAGVETTAATTIGSATATAAGSAANSVSLALPSLSELILPASVTSALSTAGEMALAAVGGVTGAVSAAAWGALIAGAIMGGVWGAEVDATCIDVFWMEAPNKPRMYSFALNPSSNLCTVIHGAHDLEFSARNRNNELNLKVDGKQVAGANVKITKLIAKNS